MRGPASPSPSRVVIDQDILINAMHEGVVLQDQNGTIINFNPAALEILGLSEAQLLERDSLDPRWKAIRPDGSPFPGELHPAMQVIKTGIEQKDVIMGIVAPGRGLRWIRINSLPMKSADGVCALTTFQDITSLMEQKSLFESYSRGLDSQAIIAKTDRAGRITYVNDMFCKISEYSIAELLGRNHSILNSGFHSREFFKNLWTTISSGRVWRGEILNKAKSGRAYWVDTIISPLLDSAGKVVEYIAFRYDITTRKETEFELAQREEKLRLIFEQSNDAVMTLEPPSWRFTSANPAAIKMFEVANVEEFIARGPWNFSPECQPDGQSSAEKAQKMIEEAMRNGSNFFDWTHATSSGKKIPCTVLLSRIQEHSRTYLYAVVRDVSLEKSLETELVKTNKYLDLALEGAGLGIWDWDLRDNSVRFDRRWAEMIGLDFHSIEMQLSTWESRVHPEDLAACYRDIKAYMEGRTDLYENTHRMRHSDGSWVYILDRGRFSDWDEEGKPIRFTGTHLDITQSKISAENRLKELGDMLSSTPSCLKIINKSGELLHMNQQGLDLIEADSFQEVFRANVYDLVEESHRAAFISFNQRICAGAKETLVFEIIGLKGARRWMETYAAPYKLPNGEFGHIAITNDISQRIQAENEILKQKAVAQYQAKMASIGVLAAGVGHEINNPLMIAKGYLNAALESLDHDPDPTERVIQQLKKVDYAVNRIAKIVKGLRSFSRADSSIASFCPTDSVDESLNLISEIYEKDGIKIFADIPPECRTTTSHGNQGKLQQVLMNLISNARDAVEEKSEKRIDIGVRNCADGIVISIADNGCGITKDISEKIFDPFFTTKPVNKGTGLGLTLSYQFVKEMNGNLTFKSELGKGTTFLITLPAMVKSEQTERPTAASRLRFSGQVLLVDDDENIRYVLSEQLKHFGFTITEADNGQTALEIFMKHPEKFDMVLTDLKMPVMNGRDLIQNMLKLQSSPKPKFVIITGGFASELETSLGGLRDAIAGILFKPFEREHLQQVLSSCLSASPASDRVA